MSRLASSARVSGDEPAERIELSNARISVEFHIKRQEYNEEIDLRRRSREPNAVEAAKTATKSRVQLPDAPSWHKMPIEDLMIALSVSSISAGLSSTDAAMRLAEKGPNIIKPRQPSVILKILGYIFAGFNVLLLGCGILAIIAWRIGDPPDPNNLGLAAILFIVAAVSTIFNWYQEHTSSKVMSTIKKLLPTSTSRFPLLSRHTLTGHPCFL